MSKLSTSDIKKGVAVILKGEPHVVLDFQHHKTAQRRAVISTRLKNCITGKIFDHTYTSGETLDGAELLHKKASYLYSDPNNSYFLDSETYDQVSLGSQIIGDDAKYFKDGLEVDLLYWSETPINLILPKKVEYKVVEAPDGVRGDSANAPSKTVTLENGLTLNVPMFIKEGEIIRVNTETGVYSERVSS